MNRNVPWSVTKENWAISYRQTVSSEADAFAYEMKLMERLMPHQIAGGFFACSVATIERVWNETLAATSIVRVKESVAVL